MKQPQTNPAIESYKTFIKKLSSESAEIIMRYFRNNPHTEYKEDVTPVTIADREAELHLRKQIMEAYPEHGILGEEFPEHNPDAEYKWILDPIDGTKSFVCGTELFGTLIALLHKGQPIVGAINFPALNKLLIGDNASCTLNDESVSVRPVQSISESVLLTTDHIDHSKYQNAEKFDRLINKTKIYRTWGDCYGYYLLATGFADIMIDPIMSVWDTMALIPVIRGAGGIITDYQGKDAVSGDSIVAAHPDIHSKVIEILNG
jgi:myo-inositol-1(or 4)-monophosphatase